jgi:BsuBI/PstI restriction endonuclease domain/BsuBI/PstI restriction endonuclease HTH domain
MGKLEDAQAILKAFGLPPAQQNEAAAYTLLALAGLKEKQPWIRAGCELLRIHDVLEFVKAAYGKHYAENSRESIRRGVLHQFEQARIVDRNPDEPARPTNSGKTCYALTREAQRTIATFGTAQFLREMGRFQKGQPALLDIYRAARAKHAVEIDLPEGVKAFLSPGQHNELQAAVIHDFWPRFIPGAKLLYLGDTAKKDWHVDQKTLEHVGLPLAIHDKYPDLVFWLESRQWLILVEAVTTHGPFSPKRRGELEAMLASSRFHRVYVTAFPSWKEFKQYFEAIAWETEVWLSAVPDHMIHYNGPKFLAPEPTAATNE